jgi:hypothetical protein
MIGEWRMMTFSEALVRLKDGKKIARTGWNGKDMYLCYQRGYPEGIAINRNTAEATGILEGTKCYFLPYIMMKVVAPSPTFVPWLASQTDILAEDWVML